jgi:type I restriction enzyme S subunit
MLRVNNFKGHSLNLSEVMRIAPEIEAKYGRTRIQTGDVLLTIVGSVGQVAVVPDEISGWNIARAVAMIRPNNRELSRWISLVLRSPQSQYQLGVNANTTVQTTINLKDLRELRIPLPDEGEQRAIAHILGTLDDKIELNRRRNQTLEAMARALFKDWFVDFGPVRAKMEGRWQRGQSLPGLPAHLYDLFPDRLDDAGKPEGWEKQPLETLAALVTTSVAPGKSPETIFEHYSIPAFDAGRMPAMELGESIKSNKYIVDTDAVLVSKLNPQTPRVWLPVVATGRAICSTEFMQFVPRDRKNRPHLYCLMSSQAMQEEVLRHVTGSTGSRQRAQPAQIARVEALVPQSRILATFNHQVVPILNAVADNQRESQTLAQLRDTLLPKLISGEMRLPEVKAQVVEATA